jgi:hypothetical protein
MVQQAFRRKFFRETVMNIKQMASAAVLLLASSASFADAAAPGGNLGYLTAYPAQFAAFDSLSVATLFSKVYDFSVTAGADVYGSVASVTNGVTFSKVLIDGVDTGPLLATNGGFGFDAFDLSGGLHTLTVEGSYKAGFSIFTGSVYAVPEPESVALLLAGLGVVGFVARRRQTA